MKKGIVIAAVLSLISLSLISCKTAGWSIAQMRADGNDPPVLLKAFAAREVIPGDPWRIYLAAEDMDGDMRYVMTVFSSGGWIDTYGTVPLEGDVRGRLSGYLVLLTHLAEDVADLEGLAISMEVWIEDAAGRRSTTWTFPLRLTYSARPARPDPGEFEERYLGTISGEFPVSGPGVDDAIWVR